MASPKLRILCLHGFSQNANLFRKRTAVLRKDLAPIAELVYISAPHLAPVTEDEVAKLDANKLKNYAASEWTTPSVVAANEDAARAWWIASADKTNLVGYEDSLSFVQQTWISQGPFHGILGFSQGAAFAALVATEFMIPSTATASATVERLRTIAPPMFLILISGFASVAGATDGVLDRWASQPGSVLPPPSLHVIGQSDSWVNPERSRDLAPDALAKAGVTVLYHEGGHLVPTGAEMRLKFREYVGRFVNGAGGHGGGGEAAANGASAGVDGQAVLSSDAMATD
ncbi:serine hydrolase FSH [Zopfochytrium polystomum]|nr:serine hydrolase FSH [Zopfochytrium polystomum]